MRFIIGALAVIGVVALVTGEAVSAGTVATGFLWLLLPLLFVKFMLFGRAFGRRGDRHGEWGGPPWMRRGEYRGPDPEHGTEAPDRSADFEEWHRMAHARQEVDSWVEDAPDSPGDAAAQ